MRGLIQKNPVVGGAIAAVVVLLAVVLAWPKKEAKRIEQYWYFDLNTHELFEGPTDQYLPIDAPSGALANSDAAPETKGKAGVLAHVFSCGECTEGEQYIGWLEYQKELVPYVEGEDEAAAQKKYMEAHLMRAEDGEKWIIYDSEEGDKIRLAAHTKCGGKKPTKCLPD